MKLAHVQLGLGDQGDRGELVQVSKCEETRRRSVSPYGEALHSNRKSCSSVLVPGPWWSCFDGICVLGLSYGQNILENTLRSHWDQFNPSAILAKCIHYKNWTAASVVRLPPSLGWL